MHYDRLGRVFNRIVFYHHTLPPGARTVRGSGGKTYIVRDCAAHKKVLRKESVTPEYECSVHMCA